MMHDNMDDWHRGFGFSHWEFGILFWVIVFLVVASLAKYLLISKNDVVKEERDHD